jgi:hypothetical protein
MTLCSEVSCSEPWHTPWDLRSSGTVAMLSLPGIHQISILDGLSGAKRELANAVQAQLLNKAGRLWLASRAAVSGQPLHFLLGVRLWARALAGLVLEMLWLGPAILARMGTCVLLLLAGPWLLLWLGRLLAKASLASVAAVPQPMCLHLLVPVFLLACCAGSEVKMEVNEAFQHHFMQAARRARGAAERGLHKVHALQQPVCLSSAVEYPCAGPPLAMLKTLTSSTLAAERIRKYSGAVCLRQELPPHRMHEEAGQDTSSSSSLAVATLPLPAMKMGYGALRPLTSTRQSCMISQGDPPNDWFSDGFSVALSGACTLGHRVQDSVWRSMAKTMPALVSHKLVPCSAFVSFGCVASYMCTGLLKTPQAPDFGSYLASSSSCQSLTACESISTCVASVLPGLNQLVLPLPFLWNAWGGAAMAADGIWSCRGSFTCVLEKSAGSPQLPGAIPLLSAESGAEQSLQSALRWLATWCSTTMRKVGLSAPAMPWLLALPRRGPAATASLFPATLRPWLQTAMDQLLNTCEKRL